MTTLGDPWNLPGPDRWLEDLAERLGLGLLLVPPMPGAPPGLIEGLIARCRSLHDRQDICCDAAETRQPAAILAKAVDCAPSLDALASAACDQQLVVLRLAPGATGQIAPWQTFLGRLAEARRNSPGLCLLVAEAPAALRGPDLPWADDWHGSLGRGDRVIWAEEHLPRARNGLAAELAVALAVELCGWRLDLAADLAQASLDDLADPLGWLARRSDDDASAEDDGAGTGCPIALHRIGDRAALQRRVWRAHLATLFPALEEARLDFINRYRKRLRVDDHLSSLGVTSVDEIELGALRRQLHGALDRREANRLESFARLRNCLAHRQPGAPEDCRLLLTAGIEWPETR
jgi:hypothetical protein